MSTREVIIGSASGLHARPARIFTQAAAGTGVRIAKGDSVPVEAASILRVMALGAARGDVVTLIGDDDATLDSLADLLSRDLDDE